MERLTNIQLNKIHINDPFWTKYQSLVREKMIPYQWEVLNDRVEGASKSHCIENFSIAAGLSDGEYYGQVFQDSDIAKWIEAVGFGAADGDVKEMEICVDQVTEILEKAQMPDGYLDTYFMIKEPDGKWSNLREGHELYVAGHMIEAAIAYYENTGKRKLVEIVERMADNICRIFGPGEEQIHGCPGHPEIELALVKLFRLTGKKEYLDTAYYFLNMRGTSEGIKRFDEEQKRPGFQHIFQEFEHLGYNNIQSHKPVREQEKADGHAVRALYLYSSMVDVGYETGDASLIEAAKRLYENVTTKQMYITGSVGAAADGECFTCDYDLPNNYNYSETCASVALMMLANRLFQVERDGKYVDIVEQALYNTVLSGMSLVGTEFFYVNPLEVIPDQLATNRTLHHVLPERKKWMGVACCPPNIARTVMSLGNYALAKDDDTVFLNLFISGEAEIQMKSGKIRLSISTEYPFEEKVKVVLSSEAGVNARLAVREPQWTKISAVMNEETGDALQISREKGYIYTDFLGEETTVSLVFSVPLRTRWMISHPRLSFNSEKTAIMRGPLVYCLEEIDNGCHLSEIRIVPDGQVNLKKDMVISGKLVTALELQAERISENNWNNCLYQEYQVPEKQIVTVTAVPYCTWNNRGIGEMKVWIPISR